MTLDDRLRLELPKGSLVQYGFRPEENEIRNYAAPPVRLLALSRDNYWPLAVLGPYNGEPVPTSRLPYVAGKLRPSGNQ
jgi:hypothetical protein